MSEQQDRELQRFFDGELSPRRARKVYARIEADPEDQRRLEGLEQMRTALRDTCEAEADDADFSNLFARVQQGIARDDEVASSRTGGWLLRWGMVLASAAAAAVLAVVLLNPTKPPTRNDCVIESLDIGPGATSTIFTIDDPELADATTVIWVNEAQGEE